ncbi:hypothetical protein LWC34_42395 [Kibdelosporangium philippinense]|uniref:Uncharacterized protein n=1 Tax=Kibdelosporangium philippinense TaxID=211113 RepID=A0ABS8ZNT7_9PSEU|nr:hypothetical protein [Kibdelosporangium philippinense]MCE7009421.1 hypothetical protein [Kibdelosporangium philippinense]
MRLGNTYCEQCGDGYLVVDKKDFPDKRGTVYLTYNSATEMHCVVTVRAAADEPTFMEAFIRKVGEDKWANDPGAYTDVAGPVYLAAADSCIDWGGTIGTAIEVKKH